MTTATTVDLEIAITELDVADVGQLKMLLFNAGITGKRHSATSCPIANYVRLRTGIQTVAVTPTYVKIYEVMIGWQSEVPLPTAARYFIIMFDDGLIAEFRSTYERFKGKYAF